ncbi:uncharacterized protein LOC116847283 [Odontomachus brunneus]|uniref:uncharacterized protein LOC116847283 n=1 Tax=Odontomachus brunneus TaxID=486640 RepID=UPI0013F27E9C|nr:uncharacterized protein LOC116847283 [Odontomachus brunneus]
MPRFAPVAMNTRHLTRMRGLGTEATERDEDLADKCQSGVAVVTLRQCENPSMDWRNEESDHSSVENLKWDENDVRKKNAPTLRRNVRSQEVQVELGVCRDIRKFTSVLENLELETKDQDHARFRTKDVQTNYFSDSEQEEIAPVFKTREKSTFQLVLQGPEILNFQGTRHSPADIAPYWKKDSRMWLWKSVRLARKIRRTKARAVPPLCRKELS